MDEVTSVLICEDFSKNWKVELQIVNTLFFFVIVYNFYFKFVFNLLYEYSLLIQNNSVLNQYFLLFSNDAF